MKIDFDLTRSPAIPIFIISFNRGAFLERCVRSYQRMNRRVKIIIHDNGSDDPATIAILEKLEREGCKVYRRGKISDANELINVNETIASYFKFRRKRRYVVTDCDIDLSIASPKSLDVYDHLLDLFPDAESVGPMLKIRDIPKYYPLYKSAMNRHIKQFWQKIPEWSETKFGTIATIPCTIDTTFALIRAGEPFFRQKKARRVYYPYEARHLDWYQDNDAYRSSNYFQTSSKDVAHWSNQTVHDEFVKEELECDHLYYVEMDLDGSLKTRREDILGYGFT